MGFHPSAYMEPPTPRTLIGLVEIGGGREGGGEGTLHRPPPPSLHTVPTKHDQARGEYHSPAKLTDPFLNHPHIRFEDRPTLPRAFRTPPPPLRILSTKTTSVRMPGRSKRPRVCLLVDRDQPVGTTRTFAIQSDPQCGSHGNYPLAPVTGRKAGACLLGENWGQLDIHSTQIQ